jgi:hypothetical protein
MELELSNLKQQVSWLKGYAVISSLVLIYLSIVLFSMRNREVLRLRGLVIEDAQGRDRILIGAPVPASRDRIRTDLEKVKAAFAPKLGGDAYLKDYPGLSHEAHGLVFLNEQGHDKLHVGEKLPDAITGKRIVSASGFTFNDDEGFERGGFGISRTETGEYRTMLGMDDPNGSEAVHLFVLEDGSKGLRVVHEGGQLVLGRFKPNNAAVESLGELSGLSFVDEEGKVLWEQNVFRPKQTTPSP